MIVCFNDRTKSFCQKAPQYYLYLLFFLFLVFLFLFLQKKELSNKRPHSGEGKEQEKSFEK